MINVECRGGFQTVTDLGAGGGPADDLAGLVNLLTDQADLLLGQSVVLSVFLLLPLQADGQLGQLPAEVGLEVLNAGVEVGAFGRHLLVQIFQILKVRGEPKKDIECRRAFMMLSSLLAASHCGSEQAGLGH